MSFVERTPQLNKEGWRRPLQAPMLYFPRSYGGVGEFYFIAFSANMYRLPEYVSLCTRFSVLKLSGKHPKCAFTEMCSSKCQTSFSFANMVTLKRLRSSSPLRLICHVFIAPVQIQKTGTCARNILIKNKTLQRIFAWIMLLSARILWVRVPAFRGCTKAINTSQMYLKKVG